MTRTRRSRARKPRRNNGQSAIVASSSPMAHDRRVVSYRPLRWQALVGQALEGGASRAIRALREKLGLNTETKFFDDDTSGFTAALSASWTTVMTTPVIAQGATITTRNGASIRVTRELMRFVIQPGSTTTLNGIVRVVAIRQRSVGPVFSQITAAQTFDGAISAISMTSGNLFDQDVEVVYDRVFAMDSTTATGWQAVAHDEVECIPEDFHLTWTAGDTTGANANLIAGAITWFACTLGFGTANPQISMRRRYEFVDN